MNNYDVFELMQNMSSMYIASNKMLQCNTNCGIDIRNIRLYEVTNQTYDTISKNLYATENILDAMQYQNVTYVYLIQGTGSEIHYYYGIAPLLNKKKQMDDILCEIKQGEEALLANFEANYPGSNIIELTKEEKGLLHQDLLKEQCCAVIEGVPGVISSSSTTLGMDRFVKVMEQEPFLALVLAQPLCENEVSEIVCNHQNVLDFLTPLLEFSKVKQQSNVNEVASLIDRFQANTRTHTNTSSEQLQFQLFSSSGLFPLKLGKGSLQEIEDLFFTNGVANNDLIELIGSLCLEQNSEVTSKNKDKIEDINKDTNKDIKKDKNEDTSLQKEEVVTIKEIGAQRAPNSRGYNRRRNAFSMPWMRRNNQCTRHPNWTPNNVIEKNVEAIGVNNIQHHHNSENMDNLLRTRKKLENRELENIDEEIIEEENNNEAINNEESGLSDVEELAADLFLGQNEFTLASINRQDSKATAKVRSCANNTRIAVNMRDACTNTCSVTERYINHAVGSWSRYLIDIMNSRLLYGQNRGIYVCSTTLFSSNEASLAKAVAAWRGMNEYDTVSKVPQRETMICKDTNQYNNIVNFQIPKHFYSSKNNISLLSNEEILARSAYSQFAVGNYMYGGNWISSKELKHMVTLPLKSTCTSFISRNNKGRNKGPELSITSVNTPTFPELDRKKMRYGCVIVGERHSGREETLKSLLLKFERPFTLLEYDSGKYSRMFKGKQRVERYPVLLCAGKILKINPFELFPEELIDNHVEILLATFIHCYGFDPMLIDIIKDAIYESYISFGWNLYTNCNEKFGKLAYTKEVNAFPTFFHVLVKTEEIIKKRIKDNELQFKCLSRIREALNGWTIGKKGALLGGNHSMNLTALMEQNISLELEELINEGDRRFFTLLYMWRCMAMRKSQGRMDYISNHVIVLEDIGRILNKDTGKITPWEENAIKTITEFILTSMKYGESVVLIEEGVSSLPTNIRSELYAVFIHQISNSKERNALEQWLDLKKDQIELLSEIEPTEFICITRDNLEVYECKE